MEATTVLCGAKMVNNGISPAITTIIRVHATRCIPLLKRAIFSLVGQKTTVAVSLVCQNLSFEEVSNLEKELLVYRFGAIAGIQCTRVPHEPGTDVRSKLLNVGVRQVATPYFAILDYDDVLYPNAYADLIRQLEKSQSAIAFGGIVTSRYFEVSGQPYVYKKYREYTGESRYDFFVDNFCPIHSFVVAKHRVSDKHLYFDEELSALEDYDFLLRLTANYKSDFSLCDTVIGEYFKSDSETISRAGKEYPNPELRVSKLESAREIIAKRKRETVTTVNLSEFAWLMDRSAVASAVREKVIPTKPAVMGWTGLPMPELELLLNELLPALDRLPESEFALIDQLEGTVLGGWVREPDLCGDLKLLAISAKGKLSSAFERHDRGDVRIHFDTDYFEHGFKADLPAEFLNAGRPTLVAFEMRSGKGFRIKYHS